MLATGYSYKEPGFLGGIEDRIRRDAKGRFDVVRGVLVAAFYGVKFSVQERSALSDALAKKASDCENGRQGAEHARQSDRRLPPVALIVDFHTQIGVEFALDKTGEGQTQSH